MALSFAGPITATNAGIDTARSIADVELTQAQTGLAKMHALAYLADVQNKKFKQDQQLHDIDTLSKLSAADLPLAQPRPVVEMQAETGQPIRFSPEMLRLNGAMRNYQEMAQEAARLEQITKQAQIEKVDPAVVEKFRKDAIELRKNLHQASEEVGKAQLSILEQTSSLANAGLTAVSQDGLALALDGINSLGMKLPIARDLLGRPQMTPQLREELTVIMNKSIKAQDQVQLGINQLDFKRKQEKDRVQKIQKDKDIEIGRGNLAATWKKVQLDEKKFDFEKNQFGGLSKEQVAILEQQKDNLKTEITAYNKTKRPFEGALRYMHSIDPKTEKREKPTNEGDQFLIKQFLQVVDEDGKDSVFEYKNTEKLLNIPQRIWRGTITDLINGKASLNVPGGDKVRQRMFDIISRKYSSDLAVAKEAQERAIAAAVSHKIPEDRVRAHINLVGETKQQTPKVEKTNLNSFYYEDDEED